MYLDAAYIVRLYLPDPGYELVRNLVTSDPDKPACLVHGRAEVCAAMHRWYREGRLSAAEYAAVVEQFEADCQRERFEWLACSDTVLATVIRVFLALPSAQFLRAGDALHLAGAAERGFEEIYSNDARLLAAAPHFSVRGVNIIP